jgi:hypothetical protein
MSEQMDKFIQDKLNNLTPLEKEVLDLRIKVHQLQARYAALEAAARAVCNYWQRADPEKPIMHDEWIEFVNNIEKLVALLAPQPADAVEGNRDAI